jgi:hypothetical protein
VDAFLSIKILNIITSIQNIIYKDIKIHNNPFNIYKENICIINSIDVHNKNIISGYAGPLFPHIVFSFIHFLTLKKVKKKSWKNREGFTFTIIIIIIAYDNYELYAECPY